MNSLFSVSLQHLQQQFDRRAAHFHRHDAVLREIDRRIGERLDLMKCNPARILDAGCGPGRSRAALQQRFPQAQWLGVDLSRQALRHSQASLARRLYERWQRGAWRSNPASWTIQADIARLPLLGASIDLLYSNLALLYCPQPHVILAEWARVLAPGGLLMFATLGPDSLRELRAAGWNEAVLPFVDMHDLGDILTEQGFTTPVVDMEKLTLTYESTQAMFKELHALTGNAQTQRARGLQGVQSWRTGCTALEHTHSPDQRLSITLEVIYGHAWRGAARQTRHVNADGSTWIGVPIHHLKNRR